MIAVLVAELWWWLALRGKSTEPSPWGGSDLLRSLPAGFLLAAMLLPQTIGLQSTSAAKSGFLTTLYVLLVPLLSQVALRHRVPAMVYVYVAVALAGTALLMGLQNAEPLNPGDLWTLVCAVGAAFHILYVGVVADRIRDGFRFNTFQSFFCLLFTLPVLFWQDGIRVISDDGLAWAGLIALAIGSSIIGFTIQVRAQKVLSPTTASMLFLLESPFALVFGLAILGETLNLTQTLGAGLILVAAVLTLKSDSAANSK